MGACAGRQRAGPGRRQLVEPPRRRQLGSARLDDEEERHLHIAIALSRQEMEDAASGAGQSGGASSSMSNMD